MRQLAVVFAAAVSLAASATALGQKPTPISSMQVPTEEAVIGDVAPAPINVACAANIAQVATSATLCPSFDIDMQGYTELGLRIVYVFATATAIQVFTDSSMGATPADPDVNKITAGDIPWAKELIGDASVHPTVTMDVEVISITTTASDTFNLALDKLNGPFYRFRFVGVGAAAGDTIQVFITRFGK